MYSSAAETKTFTPFDSAHIFQAAKLEKQKTSDYFSYFSVSNSDWTDSME